MKVKEQVETLQRGYDLDTIFLDCWSLLVGSTGTEGFEWAKSLMVLGLFIIGGPHC